MPAASANLQYIIKINNTQCRITWQSLRIMLRRKNILAFKKLNKNKSKKTLDDKCLQVKILLSQKW